ncbi:MAG: pyridoxamine 5'-phosphate oxidase family protein [Salinimicrobium sediminis]|uniref:General stress protein 26 n=1 Tax=Salinimicrobium sediminis TaxID=1343891 RepID=A0A285X1F5_9FLAO|nr:pyridoxamine 5'-phosphate oxidase family protein [Salinimicrobium sediminis]MDX1602466.1 pyridoxamine 5'-phosphate oxidase family protein [Salinimicrobium sediminis]SOC78836.1 General stress protein 26 [Salinimicrobium sediminis]
MSTENLNKEESWDRLRDMVDDIKVAMMVTGLEKRPINAVPMRTKKVDDKGNIWFVSMAHSDHNKDLQINGDIHLLYSAPDDNEFLTVYGQAEITKDKSVLKDLYSATSDNWFDGVDDPNLTAIKVKPAEAYYWDSKTNKYVTLLKMGIGALTGENQDVGEKGKLNL